MGSAAPRLRRGPLIDAPLVSGSKEADQESTALYCERTSFLFENSSWVMRPLSALHEPTPRRAGTSGQIGYSWARPAAESHRFDCTPITNLRIAGIQLRTMAQLNIKSTGIMCNPVMDPHRNVDRCSIIQDRLRSIVESIVVSLFSPGWQRNAIVAIHHPAETAGGGCGVRMPQALEIVTDCA